MQSILGTSETNTGMDTTICKECNFMFNPLPGDIIDVANKQLLTRDIVVNMDGGVGGSWKEVDYIEVNGQKLPMNQAEPFIPDFHD